jgi:hypothetical protein
VSEKARGIIEGGAMVEVGDVGGRVVGGPGELQNLADAIWDWAV